MLTILYTSYRQHQTITKLGFEAIQATELTTGSSPTPTNTFARSQYVSMHMCPCETATFPLQPLGSMRKQTETHYTI